MRCIYCKYEDTSVVDTRPVDNKIKRRRECKVCKKRFNTFEEIEIQPIIVIKKNGCVVPFDRNKIFNGILRALVKRKVTNQEILDIVVDIESDIRINYPNGISTTQIGNLILEKLLTIDEVAYVRFASVYNKFENLDSFIQIINDIKKGKIKKWKNKLQCFWKYYLL